MKILIACEESQTVCKAMRELGHEAYSADIQEPSGGHPEWHILGDVLPIINGNCEFTTMDGVIHKIDGRWDLLIAHPPCTYMSAAGACRMYPHKGFVDEERYKRALEAAKFFNKFRDALCDKVAIENPRPLKIVGLPKETQQIQPYQFGSLTQNLHICGFAVYLLLFQLKLYRIINPMFRARQAETRAIKARQEQAEKAGRQKQEVKLLRALRKQWLTNGQDKLKKKTARTSAIIRRGNKIDYSGIIPHLKGNVK